MVGHGSRASGSGLRLEQYMPDPSDAHGRNGPIAAAAPRFRAAMRRGHSGFHTRPFDDTFPPARAGAGGERRIDVSDPAPEAPIDVLVLGGGISGLAFALKAAQAGKRTVLLEALGRLGGCIHSERAASGYWFELGAHTTYNSYGGFLDLTVAAGAVPLMRERGPARSVFGFLKGTGYSWLTPPKVLLELGWLEAAVHAPLGLFGSGKGKTVAERFSALVGKNNFARVLSPFLSAVPSQKADTFPAEGPGSLFKKRPRRKEFLRSFGFEGGLQVVCDGVAAKGGFETLKSAPATSVERTASGLRVHTESGRTFDARTVAVATGPKDAAGLLAGAFPEVAKAIGAISTVEVDSVGVVLPVEKAWMPACAFVVPQDDAFFSVVTRDPFPDGKSRGFAFHFKPGLSREARLQRVRDVLRVKDADFLHLAEKHLVLPAPVREHAQQVEAIDRALFAAGGPGLLALTGNYFEGLAIEDCVLRSFAEWERVSGKLVK
jgi:protoporphyrinogen/coproporphyrinogen III oxidase